MASNGPFILIGLSSWSVFVPSLIDVSSVGIFWYHLFKLLIQSLFLLEQPAQPSPWEGSLGPSWHQHWAAGFCFVYLAFGAPGHSSIKQLPLPGCALLIKAFPLFGSSCFGRAQWMFNSLVQSLSPYLAPNTSFLQSAFPGNPPGVRAVSQLLREAELPFLPSCSASWRWSVILLENSVRSDPGWVRARALLLEMV